MSGLTIRHSTFMANRLVTRYKVCLWKFDRVYYRELVTTFIHGSDKERIEVIEQTPLAMDTATRHIALMQRSPQFDTCDI